MHHFHRSNLSLYSFTPPSPKIKTKHRLDFGRYLLGHVCTTNSEPVKTPTSRRRQSWQFLATEAHAFQHSQVEERLWVWKTQKPGHLVMIVVVGCCWFVGLLVCWFVGLLVCWFVGLLVCWFVGLLVCWFVGLLVCWFVGLLVCWFVGCWFVGLLVCWFVGLLVCWFVGLLVVGCWLLVVVVVVVMVVVVVVVVVVLLTEQEASSGLIC